MNPAMSAITDPASSTSMQCEKLCVNYDTCFVLGVDTIPIALAKTGPQ